MNKSLTLNKNNFPLLQAHSKKSLLTVAIFVSLGAGSNVYAAVTVNCTDADSSGCNSQIIPPPSNGNSDNTINVDKMGYSGTSTIFGNFPELNISPSNNTINIKNGSISITAIAGYSQGGGDVKGNTINVSGNGKVGTMRPNGMVGGYIDGAGNADNNHLTITDNAEITGNAIASQIKGEGNVTNSTVIMNGGTVNGAVASGYTGVSPGNATENDITINDGVITGKVYGGKVNGIGDSLLNTVSVNGGQFSSNVYGGYSKTMGKANKNRVTIDNGNVDKNIYGGYAHTKGDATENIVHIYNNSNIGDIDSWSGEVHAGHSEEGNVNNNTLNIDGGTIGFYSYGGYSEKGNANANAITFNTGTAGNIMHGGYSASSGDANENTITIDGGTAKWGVFGGFSWEGEANNNTVTLNSGFAEMGLHGAKTPNNAEGNIVNVNGGIVGNTNTIMGPVGGIFGAKIESLSLDGSATGSATENTVNFNGGELKVEHIIGAYTEQGNATKNEVNITDGTIINNVYGGFSETGTVEKNTATIKGGTISGMVYAGYAKSGDAKSNSIVISDGKVTKQSVRAGHSETANANNNSALISGTADVKNVYGGITNSTSGGKNANRNIVTIEGGKTNDIFGGSSGNGNANENQIIINGGVIGGFFGGHVYGGQAVSKTGTANNNSVTMSNGKVGEKIYGGYAYENNANGNTLAITGGEVKYLYGGRSEKGSADGNTVSVNGSNTLVKNTIHGGFAEGSASVMGNTVTIKDSTLKGSDSAYGGYSRGNSVVKDNTLITDNAAIKGSVYGGSSSEGNAESNTLTIKGGSIDGAVFGGNTNNKNKKAINNIINIKDTPTFGQYSILFGGYNGWKVKTGDAFTGNMLNLHSKDVTVSDVKNFENYNFYLSNDVDKGSTMLKLTSTNATDLSASNYGVGVKTGTTTLPQGYTVTLIESATTLTLSSPNPANDITNMTDIVSGYEFRLSVKDGNKLVAELPYTVTIENSDPSKGSVSNESEAAYLNETITFDATPNPGYIVTINSTCGTKGSWNDNTYTSSEITDKCTITVNWEEINYTIGGTVSSLNGSITLQNNTGNDLTLNANGEFTFTATAVHDDNYSVTVSSQPAGQECTVDNGSGTINDSNISDITVTCSDVITIGTIFSDSFE